jgi:dTDP-4-dehydrorhamnose reductase
VRETCPDALIIRTNFFGWGTGYRQSFSDIIIGALRRQRSITLFDDVYYTPILAESLVKAVHDLLERKGVGVFNVVSSQRLTKYRFGMLLAEAFDLDPAPIRCGSLSDFPGLVNRPRDMSLSNRKVCDFLGRDVGPITEQLNRLREHEQTGLASELSKL